MEAERKLPRLHSFKESERVAVTLSQSGTAVRQKLPSDEPPRNTHRHRITHRRLVNGSVSSLRPHLRQGVRRLPTSNILDVIHECILSRRQHHRRQRPEQNLSIYRCLFFDGYLGIFPSKRIQK